MERSRDGFTQSPFYGDWCVTFPGNEVDFAAANEGCRLRANLLRCSHEEMNSLSLSPVITKTLPILRNSLGALLALPSELTVGYPEQRFVALGHLEGRLHSICFTPAKVGFGSSVFEKASRREVRYHAEKT